MKRLARLFALPTHLLLALYAPSGRAARAQRELADFLFHERACRRALRKAQQP